MTINYNVGKLGRNDKTANYIVQFDSISGIVPSNINVSNNIVNVSGSLIASSGNFNSLTVSGVRVSVSGHGHGNINSSGQIGSVANRVITTSDDGLLVANNDVQFECSSIFIGVSGDYINNGGIILAPGAIVFSDNTTQETAYTGKIGSIANLPLITTTSGIVTTGTFGTTANTFCQGNDSRLSDARTPISHTHTSSDITDFNSSVSGLLPANLATGIGVSGYVTRWIGTNDLTSGVIFDNATNVGISNINPTFKLDVSGVVRSSSYITSDTEFRLNNQAFSRVASVDSNGGFAGGYNIYLSGLTPKHNSVGAIAGTHYYSDGSIRFFTNSSQAATTDAAERLRINSGGNVGIGISNPVTPLEISGALKFANCDTRVIRGDNSSVALSGAASNNLGHFGLYIDHRNTTGGRLYRLAAHTDGTTGSFRIRDDSAGADRLTITSAGDVGIGVTNPSSRLVVDGDVNIGSGNNVNRSLTIWGNNVSSKRTVLKNVNGDTVLSFIVGNQSLNLGETSARFFNINYYAGAAAGGNHNFFVSGTSTPEVMIGSGAVGIGTTSPSGRLDVAGDAYFRNVANTMANLYFRSTAAPSDTSLRIRTDVNANLFLDATNASVKVGNQSADVVLTAGNAAITIGHSATQTIANQNIIFRPANIERFRINGAGDVGIGTATPSGRLHVVGTGLFASITGLVPNALLDIYSTTSGEMVFNVEGTNGSLFSVIDSLSGSLMSVNNNAGLPIFEVFSDDSIVGGRFNQNDFVISSGGNIGIGKASPSVKLDVVGTVAVSGAFSATTKSFKINHPSKPGYVLEYGSLESPYHGVRLTGKDTVVNGICIVNLPDYIKDLVLDDDSINIQITNYKHTKILYVQDIKVQHNTFEIGCDTNGLYDFFWTFTGLRKDIPQIVTEYPL